jgi:outer membrane lipoprotein-sorting protein
VPANERSLRSPDFQRQRRRFCGCCGAIFLFAAVACGLASAQAQPDSALEHVLDQMDKARADFTSLQADFVWEQYTFVVHDTDAQKGKVYFRRNGHDIEMAADITYPNEKYVLFSRGKVQMFQPVLNRVTVYNAGKNREEVESFLVLGFGAGGHELLKSFDVKYLGSDQVDGIQTSELDLIPRSEKVQKMFPHIELWIDPARGISVKQKLFQPDGDYRLATYSNIRMHERISDSVFKLKTNSKTTYESTGSQN